MADRDGNADTSLHSHLHRLVREAYRGEAGVHWTMTIQDRAVNWLTPQFHAACREVLVHTVFKHYLVCPIYCLMPDHVHLLWLGFSAGSDQLEAAAFFRKHVNELLKPYRFQRQAYDHVLREGERERGAFEKTAWYVRENPVRAGLVGDARKYPYAGCVLPGYPELMLYQTDYWERFWRVYGWLLAQARDTKRQP